MTGAPPARRAPREPTDPQRIEEPFGWITTIAGERKLRYIGRQRNRAWFKVTAAVDMIRITALDTTPA